MLTEDGILQPTVAILMQWAENSATLGMSYVMFCYADTCHIYKHLKHFCHLCAIRSRLEKVLSQMHSYWLLREKRLLGVIPCLSTGPHA